MKPEKHPNILLSALPGLVLVLVMFAVKLYEISTGFSLVRWGLFPRDWSHIWGIFTIPFLHADWDHFWSNATAFFVLSWCIFYFYHRVAWEVMSWLYLISGFWLWIAGRPSFHIGASVMVYGMVTYLFFSGILRRDKITLAVAMLVVFLYGSLIWGIVPIFHVSFSWEGHLLGAISGLAISWGYRKLVVYEEPIISDDDSLNEMRYGEQYWDPSKISEESSPKMNVTYHYKPKSEDRPEGPESMK